MLRDLAFEELKKTLGDRLLLGSMQELSPPISDTRRWVIQKDGLGIQFREYEVTSYSEGMPIVTIRWSRLAGHLTELARGEFGVGVRNE